LTRDWLILHLSTPTDQLYTMMSLVRRNALAAGLLGHPPLDLSWTINSTAET